MFSSHKCPYLYKPISVVTSSKLAIHTYKNPYDKGILSNIKEYLKLCWYSNYSYILCIVLISLVFIIILIKLTIFYEFNELSYIYF